MIRARIKGDIAVRYRMAQLRDTLRTIGRTGAAIAAADAMGKEVQANFKQKGALHADATGDLGPYPWGRYVRNRGPQKRQGDVYTLVETGATRDSVSVRGSRYYQLEQTALAFTVRSLVPYAEHVQARWGVFLAPGKSMKAAVQKAVEDWLIESFPDAVRRK